MNEPYLTLQGDVLTQSDQEDILAAQVANANRYRGVLQEDGSTKFEYNQGGGLNYVVAAQAANANGGVMDHDKFLAAARETAQAYASAFDGTNRDELCDRAFNEMWYDGCESMFSGDGEERAKKAQSELMNVITDTMNRCLVSEGDVKTVHMSAIDATIKAYNPARNSAYARIMKLYKPGNVQGTVVIDEEAARHSNDLFNLWEGKRYDRMHGDVRVEADPMKKLYWADTHPGEKMPQDLKYFDHAREFAQWLYDTKGADGLDAEVEKYRQYFAAAVKERILKRLMAERAKNKDLNYDGEFRIVREELENKNWNAHLTQDDVNRALTDRMGEYRIFAPDGMEKALEKPRELVRKGKEEADALGLSKEGKKRLEAEAKAKAEEEKLRNTSFYAASNGKMPTAQRQARKWGLHPDIDKEYGKGAVISTNLVKKLKKELRWQEGDEIVLKIAKGSKIWQIPVVDTTDQDDGYIYISTQDAINMKSTRDKKLQCEGQDQITFGIIRAKDKQ